jgi:hypothetical protein
MCSRVYSVFGSISASSFEISLPFFPHGKPGAIFRPFLSSLQCDPPPFGIYGLAYKAIPPGVNKKYPRDNYCDSQAY